jgi:hypothetical protein
MEPEGGRLADSAAGVLMSWKTIALKAGIDVEMTPTLNMEGWSQSNLIRWRDGMPEKNGGWLHLTSSALTGTARGMVTWAGLTGTDYLAVGTEQTLTLFTGNTLYDITPYEVFSNPTNPFHTVMGSGVVTLVDTAIPAAATVKMNVVVPVSVGGLLLFGPYTVTETLGVATFNAGSNATSSATGGTPPQFSVTMSSAVVTTTLNNHGLISGNSFTVQVATVVGGITLPAGSSHTVTVVNANSFTFIGPSNATSTTSVYENSGNARLAYQITPGYVSNDNAGHILREWFLDHWGDQMIGNAGGTNNDLGFLFGSPIFVWDPLTLGVNNHAIAINTNTFPGATDPPQAANFCFVNGNEQILIVLGAEPPGGANQDPNLARWCDASDYTDWVATTTNLAGSFRIPTGSRLVGGLRAPLYTVIWTDVDMWLVSFLGFPLVFGFNQVSNSVGLIAPRAAVAVLNSVYLVAPNGIYQFDGNSVSIVPCPVWDILFRNLNRAQLQKMFMAANSWFNEVAVFFPSASGAGEVDTYIRYNYREGSWDYGSLVRTCWVDAGVFGGPIGVDAGGILQQHESGNSADGSPMGEFIQSGWMSISDGVFFSFLERVIADFIFAGASPTVQFWILVSDYPTDTPTTYGPFTAAPSGPQYQLIRARGRVAALKIGGSGLNSFWRLGNFRYLLAPGGRR